MEIVTRRDDAEPVSQSSLAVFLPLKQRHVTGNRRQKMGLAARSRSRQHDSQG